MNEKNYDQELLDSFFQETYPILQSIEMELLGIENKPYVEGLFTSCLSAIHTIKGTAACLGLDKMAEFCHEYESFIVKVESGEIPYNAEAIDVLLSNLDFLKEVCFDIFENSCPSSKIENFDRKIPFESNKRSCVSVPFEDFDNFLECGEEAISLIRTLVKLKDNSETIKKSLLDLDSVILKIQKQITDMRKVPLGRIFGSLEKFVRDYGGKNNKKVEVKVEGAEMAVDFAIAKTLDKILIHLVNNSLFHGIEEVDARKKMGKPETGTISIRCLEESDSVVVVLEDDGCGFDRKKIISCAVSKGKVPDETSEEKLLEIIFDRDFSTAEEITKISGRGIGMTAVKSLVKRMNGRVELRNNFHQGCRVKISLPNPGTLKFVKTLGVKIYENHYSIPASDVFDIVNGNSGDNGDIVIHDLAGGWVLSYGNLLLPLVHLGRYLNQGKELWPEVGNIVVVRNESYIYGLIVEHIGEMEEVVVKRGIANNERYCAGVALVGGGQISLVLDVDGIGKDCKIKKHCGGHVERRISEEGDTKSKQYVFFDLDINKNYAILLDYIFCIESIQVDEIDWMGEWAVVSRQGKKMSLVWVESELGLCGAKNLKNCTSQYRHINVLVTRWKGEYLGLVVGEIGGIGETPGEMDETISDREGIVGVVVIGYRIASVVNLDFLLRDWRGGRFSVETPAA